MRRLVPQQASQILMQRIVDAGLPAYTWTNNDGQACVHVGPSSIQQAGTDIVVIDIPGACAYISEWGNRIGDTRSLPDTVNYVLWLFGRAHRTRHKATA